MNIALLVWNWSKQDGREMSVKIVNAFSKAGHNVWCVNPRLYPVLPSPKLVTWDRLVVLIHRRRDIPAVLEAAQMIRPTLCLSIGRATPPSFYDAVDLRNLLAIK